jgi:hypothetical protein
MFLVTNAIKRKIKLLKSRDSIGGQSMSGESLITFDLMDEYSQTEVSAAK